MFLTLIILAILALLGYLFGAIPFGLVLTKISGLGDIREIGSGNIGATNVLRTGRKDLALLTLLLDSGKGAIAVLCAHFGAQFIGDQLGWMPQHIGFALAGPLAGAAAFLGHCFPVWLKFKGGKGVATFIGTMLAISPIAGVFAIVTWLLSAAATRISSLSALIASLINPIFAYLYGGWFAAGAAAFMAVLIIYRHHENIARLAKGEEPKIGQKK